MYVPKAFEVVDGERIRAFIDEFDFATIVSCAPTGVAVTHAPVVVRSDTSGLTVLGHVARDNPHWHVMDGSVESVIIFHGPHSYVSPTWYANSPAVPTWNYAVVHAHGKLKSREERGFIVDVLSALVGRYENARRSRQPWRLEDQPAEFNDRMLARIVGFEMLVMKIQAKFKLGQNRRTEDREGTIAGLESETTNEGMAMAAFMRAHRNEPHSN